MARPHYFDAARKKKNMPDQFELHQFARRGPPSACANIDGTHALVAESDLKPAYRSQRRAVPTSELAGGENEAAADFSCRHVHLFPSRSGSYLTYERTACETGVYVEGSV